jgi:hypothetical protein
VPGLGESSKVGIQQGGGTDVLKSEDRVTDAVVGEDGACLRPLSSEVSCSPAGLAQILFCWGGMSEDVHHLSADVV